MTSEIILGVDPGLGTTGWGVVKSAGGRVTYVDSGKLQTSPRLPMGQRLERLFTGLQQVVTTYHVTQCAVESGYVGPNAVSALSLGHARAAAMLAAETLGVPIVSFAPREIKAAVVGRGGATKVQVAYVVGRMLGLEFDEGEADISDALAVAICRAMHPERALTAKAAG
jgi:crossover junction endodeoxyribonuclease RuvC